MAGHIDTISVAYDNPCLSCNFFGSTYFFLPIFCSKVTHPLLIWASETFDCKSRPNGYSLQIAQRSQWRAYRIPPSPFLMVPSLTPYDLSFPQNGGSKCPQVPNIREWPYLCNGWSDPLHVWFYGGVFGDGGSNGVIYGSNKSKMAATAMLEKWPYLRNGRPIHFMFGYRVGFSGTADLMALFSIRTNSRWRPWIFRMAISP